MAPSRESIVAQLRYSTTAIKSLSDKYAA